LQHTTIGHGENTIFKRNRIFEALLSRTAPTIEMEIWYKKICGGTENGKSGRSSRV
jgi:hypothetical protein